MCRFYGHGLNRIYRLCSAKRGHRGQHVAWPEPRPDIRTRSGHVALRKIPKSRQLPLFRRGGKK